MIKWYLVDDSVLLVTLYCNRLIIRKIQILFENLLFCFGCSIIDFITVVKRKLFFSHSFYIFSDNKFIRRLQSLNLHFKKKQLYIRFKRSHRNYKKFAKFIKKKNYLKIFIKWLYLKKKNLYFTFTNNIYTVKFPLLNIRNLYCKRRSIHINNVIY